MGITDFAPRIVKKYSARIGITHWPTKHFLRTASASSRREQPEGKSPQTACCISNTMKYDIVAYCIIYFIGCASFPKSQVYIWPAASILERLSPQGSDLPKPFPSPYILATVLSYFHYQLKTSKS